MLADISSEPAEIILVNDGSTDAFRRSPRPVPSYPIRWLSARYAQQRPKRRHVLRHAGGPRRLHHHAGRRPAKRSAGRTETLIASWSTKTSTWSRAYEQTGTTRSCPARQLAHRQFRPRFAPCRITYQRHRVYAQGHAGRGRPSACRAGTACIASCPRSFLSAGLSSIGENAGQPSGAPLRIQQGRWWQARGARHGGPPRHALVLSPAISRTHRRKRP